LHEAPISFGPAVHEEGVQVPPTSFCRGKHPAAKKSRII